MIFPNLYLYARKVANPQEWIKFDSADIQYHYYSKPVPGIYISHRRHGTFLYALKTNGQKETENLFSSSPSNDSQMNICTHYVKIIQFYLLCRPHNHPGTCPLFSGTLDRHSLLRSVHSVKFDANPTTIPHSQHKRKKPSRCLLTFLPRIGCTKSSRSLELHDIGGYKRLREPLHIEFNKLLQRWMFSSEIQARTLITRMCTNKSCNAHEMRLCHKTARRELFLLDDGYSWVVTARERCGVMINRWSEGLKDDEVLYCVDEKTDCLRRQSMGDCWASRWALTTTSERMIFTDGDEDFLAIMRYLS